MNALEIKENRKKLNLTQAELAVKLGVSLKTVSNYEKGDVIPDTKQELLLSIFNKKNSNNTLNEPEAIYEVKFKTENDVKLILDKIKEHKKIIILAQEKNKIKLADHHSEIIKLLKQQIELITESSANVIEDLEIFNSLNNK